MSSSGTAATFTITDIKLYLPTFTLKIEDNAKLSKLLNNSIMCGYFSIGFIDFMLAGKKLTDYTNLFSPHDFKKNDDTIFCYFKNE